ncbi:putative T7SS-secreted protein [Saccharopolyspora shandongensis]|uniref:putative T7SS-secreted protein n=1 Tax=Saccharopolyspora shandongensis TaxID=418495 RepID=UPI0033F6D994
MAPDSREEVPGELPAIDETLATMTKLGTAFENAAQGFQKINTAGWEGPTADAFRDYYQQEPPKWFRAADAFTESADALRQYRDVLAWAQRQAEQACADIERADRQTAQAEARYEQAADQGNATEPFQDPGAAARNQAQAALDAAKEQVEEAAKRAAAALIKASEKAPPQPGPLTMLASGFEDVFQNVAESYGDFWKGSFDGALDMLQQARTLNPFDPYNVMHPQQYGENISQLAASTVAAGKAFISDPIGTGKAMIGAGIDSFTKDPSGFIGRLAPEVAAGLATSGSSTAGSLGRRALDTVTDFFGDKNKAPTHFPDVAPNASTHPPIQPNTHPTPQNPNPAHLTPQSHSTPSNWAPEPPSQSPTASLGHVSSPPMSHSPELQSIPDNGKPFGPQGSGWDRGPDHDAPARDTQPSNQDQPRPTYGRGTNRNDDLDWGDPWEDAGRGGTREHGEQPPSRETLEQPNDRPDHQQDAQRDEDPARHRDQDEATETAPHAPDPEPHGEPRHDLSDEDRQTYRERVESRTGAPFEESVARLREEHPELAHLDDEKAMGLRRYIGEDANTLNRVLREGDAIDRDYVGPEANVLRSALDEMPKVDTAETPRVYRDIGVSGRDLPGLLERYKPGVEIEEPAFTSASKDIPPRHFAEHGEEKDRVVRFIIEDPRNARDLSVTNPDELEVMWQEGNRFLVQAVQQVGDEVHIYTRDLGR